MSPSLKEARTASILIVDDDDIIRAIMRAELEADGFEITEAADGVAAPDVGRDRRDELNTAKCFWNSSSLRQPDPV